MAWGVKVQGVNSLGGKCPGENGRGVKSTGVNSLGGKCPGGKWHGG